MQDETNIEVTPTPVEDVLAGVPEGTILDGDEKIVHDLDENGNVIGWHKELVNKDANNG